MPTIPADAECGMGAFQTLRGMDSSSTLVKHLLNGVKNGPYGVAAPAFLERLANERSAQPKELRKYLREIQDEFLAKAVPEGADSQVGRVGERFALFASAGELGIKYGVLPWPKGEAIAANLACFKAWLRHRGGTDSAEATKAVQGARQFIEKHGEARFTPVMPPSRSLPFNDETVPEHPTYNRAGFRKTGEGGMQMFIFFEEAWKEVFHGADPEAAAKAIAAAGFLVRDKGRHISENSIGCLELKAAPASTLSAAQSLAGSLAEEDPASPQ